ncbi:hypothetical protein PspLS_08453 [Pyricularia sp. CBS 133598]|nr:hypothetical protein PspLS_08453 [Pyricularia sp. CBS 133598]
MRELTGTVMVPSGRVVCDAVTTGTKVFDVDKISDLSGFVLGLGTLKIGSIAVQQVYMAAEVAHLATHRKLTALLLIHRAKGPVVNLARWGSQEGGAGGIADCLAYALEIKIVKNDADAASTWLVVGRGNKDNRLYVAESGVDERRRANIAIGGTRRLSLAGSSSCCPFLHETKPNTNVGHGDRHPDPTPVPSDLNTSFESDEVETLSPGLADADFDVADLAIKVGRVDLPLLVSSINFFASTCVYIGRENAQSDENA